MQPRGRDGERMNTLAPLALVAAAAAASSAAYAASPPASAWEIGPVIRGKNYSVGISGTLREGPQGPWFAFPTEDQGHIHYVTLGTRPIEGARRISVRYRIDAPPSTRFTAQQTGGPGQFGLVFQRRGDNWSAKGRFETYRWYSPQIAPLSPGVRTFTARLDDPRWVGVERSTAASNPEAFAAALADTESVSLTFGDANGRGHGVYASAPARFTLLDFRIE
jgi:hypothetical protein